MAELSVDGERALALADELQRAASISVTVAPMTSMAIIAALQLAARHPDFPPSSLGIVHEVVGTLVGALGPVAQQLVEEGWAQ